MILALKKPLIEKVRKLHMRKKKQKTGFYVLCRFCVAVVWTLHSLTIWWISSFHHAPENWV